MFGKLLEAVFGLGDGTAWPKLDMRMKGTLRIWGVLSVFALIAVAVVSLYSYLQWTPVRHWLDAFLGGVKQSYERTGDIPKGTVTIGGVMIAVLLVLSLVFFWFLIDLGQMHRKIDRLTFRLVPKVGDYIIFALLGQLQCPQNSACALRSLASTSTGPRQLMTDLFYRFANSDDVGGYNQRDKREQVFGVWTQYYVFNYVMVIVTLIWLWLCLLVVIRASLLTGAVLFVVGAIALSLWIRVGAHYRKLVLQLAGEQIRAFFQHAPQEMQEQGRRVVMDCNETRCRVVPRAIRLP